MRTYYPKNWQIIQLSAKKYCVVYFSNEPVDTINGWFNSGVEIMGYNVTGKSNARSTLIWLIANTRTMTDINDVIRWCEEND